MPNSRIRTGSKGLWWLQGGSVSESVALGLRAWGEKQRCDLSGGTWALKASGPPCVRLPGCEAQLSETTGSEAEN